MSTKIGRGTFPVVKKRGQVKYSGIVTLRLEPELLEALEHWADVQDRTLASLIRVILRDAVALQKSRGGPQQSLFDTGARKKPRA